MSCARSMVPPPRSFVVESTQDRICRIACFGLLASLCWLALVPGHAAAQSCSTERKSYPVSEFFFEYALEDPALPTPAELGEIEVALRTSPAGFVAPNPNAPPPVSGSARCRRIRVSTRAHCAR